MERRTWKLPSPPTLLHIWLLSFSLKQFQVKDASGSWSTLDLRCAYPFTFVIGYIYWQLYVFLRWTCWGPAIVENRPNWQLPASILSIKVQDPRSSLVLGKKRKDHQHPVSSVANKQALTPSVILLKYELRQHSFTKKSARWQPERQRDSSTPNDKVFVFVLLKLLQDVELVSTAGAKLICSLSRPFLCTIYVSIHLQLLFSSSINLLIIFTVNSLLVLVKKGTVQKPKDSLLNVLTDQRKQQIKGWHIINIRRWRVHTKGIWDADRSLFRKTFERHTRVSLYCS